MPPKKNKLADKQLVVNAYDMLLQPFRLHCQTRHAQTMRFRTKNEHEADHRLHDEHLDHVHAVPKSEQEEGEDAGAEPDQSPDI
jgi:hypothetical protein